MGGRILVVDDEPDILRLEELILTQAGYEVDTAIDGLWPDLTLYLRIDPERGLERADGLDRFEAEGLELQRAVAAAYDEIAQIAADRVVVVDAEGSVEEVHERIVEVVESRR